MDTERSLEFINRIVGESCLEINRDKSKIIIYNMKERPEEIGGVRVVDNIKYLGVTVTN